MTPLEASTALGAYVALAHAQFPEAVEHTTDPELIRRKQSLFALLVGILLVYTALRGYAITLAEGFDDDFQGHMAHSLHYERLAQDCNLFVNEVYITQGSDLAWRDLGKFWKTLHPLCRWGGDFGDANHVSLAHNGRK